jgi:hypothetical protein
MRRQLQVVLVTAVLTMATATATTAQASNGVNTFNTLACAMPFLATGYGPIAQCTQLSTSQTTGRAGLYSPITGQFQPQTDWLEVVENGWVTGNRISATDGALAMTTGFVSLLTPFGPAVWSTQYRNGNTEGRWGNVNLITGRFYPGGDGHWTPVSAPARSGSIVPTGGIAIKQSAGAAQINTTSFLTLQMSLCNGGQAECFDDGRAVPKAREVILDWAPALVTLNETCESDVTDQLFSAMLTLYANEWLSWTFMPAGEETSSQAKECNPLNGLERGRFGNGILGRLFTANGPYFKYAGLLYPQELQNDERRSWACVDANHVYWGCTTHLDVTSEANALDQCNHLTKAVIPFIQAADGYHPTVLGGDFNLFFDPGGDFDVQTCVPSGWFRKGDGSVQHTMVTNDFGFVDTEPVDMEGTTDHPAWIVVLNRPA